MIYFNEEENSVDSSLGLLWVAVLLWQYNVWVCIWAYMLYIHKQVCYFCRFIYLVKFLGYEICLFQVFERLSSHSLSSCLKLAFFFFPNLGSHMAASLVHLPRPCPHSYSEFWTVSQGRRWYRFGGNAFRWLPGCFTLWQEETVTWPE